MNEIMLYVSVWGWMINSMMFLIAGMICLALPRNIISLIFAMSFFIIFMGCIYMTFTRKRDLLYIDIQDDE